MQHINLFSKANLKRVLNDCGLVPKSVTYFGRSYRIRYILNRLRYLAGRRFPGRLIGMLQHVPEAVARSHISIKLWDVMGWPSASDMANPQRLRLRCTF